MIELAVGAAWLIALAWGVKTRVDLGSEPELWLYNKPEPQADRKAA
jgi:hypothetical protein